MKITFIGHASILIETQGLSILSDPWWKGPCFGAQWWIYPEPYLDPVRGRKLDYLYVSHGHHDHFHPQTLYTLNKDAKVLIAKGLDLHEPIAELGFHVVEVGPNDVVDLGFGVSCQISETKNGDTMMAVTDGRETCLNLNDAVHALPASTRSHFIQQIRKRYPSIDYLFCGYGTASHFPNCYVIPGMDREKTAVMRQRYFNKCWADIVSQVAPRFAFPFAADVAFLDDDLFWCNEPVHNSERPTDVFTQQYGTAQTHVVDIAPGFVIENGSITSNRRFHSVSSEALRQSFAESISKVNHPSSVSADAVREVAQLLAQNIEHRREYFGGFAGNYKCLLKFKNSSEAIQVTKHGDVLSVTTATLAACDINDYDIVYVTRLSYLRKALSSKYGHEILFVGSGGLFIYQNPSKVTLGIHRELKAAFMRSEDGDSRRPPSIQNGLFLGRCKQLIKQLLGRQDEDLYDLQRWVVMMNK